MLSSEEIEDPEFSFSYNPNVDFTTSTSTPSLSSRLEVFPNVTREQVTVHPAESSSEVPFLLFTLSGNAALSGNFAPGNNTLDLSALPAGLYILQVEGYAPQRIVKPE